VIRLHLITIACLVLGAAATARAEMVENPQYKVWSKFGVGSSSTVSGEWTFNNQKMTMSSARKLTEKTDDHVTLEVIDTMDFGGQARTMPARKVNVPAQAEKKDVTEAGSEDVTAAGKTFSCKIYEMKDIASAHPETKVRFWINPEVPGGIVKMLINSPHGEMTMLLKSYESK